jgi:hypothetical protein
MSQRAAQTGDNTPGFAAWMRSAMAQQDVSGVVLSRVTAIAQSQLSHYATGKFEPRADNRWLIEKALEDSRASRQAIKRAQSMRTLPMIGPAELGRKLGRR